MRAASIPSYMINRIREEARFTGAVKQTMKPSRRVFMKCCTGACAAGAITRPISFQNTSVPYYKAVFDERFEDPRQFAIEARTRHIPTMAIRGDITQLFFDDLDLRWKHGPVWLTGFTTPASLFCLDLLARDRGMLLRHCDVKPRIEAALGILDRALPRRSTRVHFPESNPSDLLFWIIAPTTRASTKETANG